jgi:hypothetical protein
MIGTLGSSTRTAGVLFLSALGSAQATTVHDGYVGVSGGRVYYEESEFQSIDRALARQFVPSGRVG